VEFEANFTVRLAAQVPGSTLVEAIPCDRWFERDRITSERQYPSVHCTKNKLVGKLACMCEDSTDKRSSDRESRVRVWFNLNTHLIQISYYIEPPTSRKVDQCVDTG
jgi:hypothetical protein